MKTKIFCDIADVELVKKFNKKKIVKGFTTNPSLMRKAGAKNYASYAKKISKDEAKINWKISAKKIVAMINALHLSPGAWFNYEGSRIKILKAKEVEHKGRPGEIIDKNFTIACEKKSIQILEIQKEGKQKMSINEYLRGNTLKIGYIID